VFLPCAIGLAQGDKVTIKYGWEPGVYIMTQTSTSVSEQVVGKEKLKSKSTSTVVWELNVGVPGGKGEKKIAAKVLKCRFQEEGDLPMSYDSEAAAGTQDKNAVFVYEPLLKTPVEITMDADDAIVEVSGLDKLWTDLGTKAATDEQKMRLAEVSIEFGDKVVEQSIRRLESAVPKKPVAVGDKWTAGVRSDLPVVGEIKQRYDCSLKGIEDTANGKAAVVEMDATYELAKPRPGKVQGVEVTISKLFVTETGELRFDLAKGIVSCDEKKLKISSVVEAADEKGNPIKLESSSDNEVKVTIAPAPGADKK